MFLKNLRWILLFVLALIWGSSFILIKKGLIGLTPFQLGSLRIVFATVFLLLIGFKSLQTIPHTKWKFVALTAMVGTFFPAYLFAMAETVISSSIAAVLNSLTPLGALLIGVLAFGLQVEKRQIYGVIIGLIGSILLVLNGESSNSEQNITYTLMVVFAAFCYSLNVNLIKKYLSDVKPLAITTGNFIILLIPALIVLYITGFDKVVARPEVQTAMIYIAILGVLGTGIANIIYFKLIQMSSPVFASSVTYMIPVVAFFWGILDQELFNLMQYMGAIIIFIGIYLSAKKQS
ncbi:DMT family transporter [Flavobacterium sp.]|uniref:DMT family transporter n=1 Tax=Flavobacterium sp. TaxID=239 RepID=UPI0026280562|nr:DMT family transporter [Flavobacterium sp.]MDD3004689.1 DMT family transporter [Flavobacterium sp.]